MEVKDNCLIGLATPSCPTPALGTPPIHVHAHNSALTAEIADLKAKLRHVEAENVAYLREIDEVKADLAGERRLASVLRQRGWSEVQRTRKSEADRHDACLQELIRRYDKIRYKIYSTGLRRNITNQVFTHGISH